MTHTRPPASAPQPLHARTDESSRLRTRPMRPPATPAGSLRRHLLGRLWRCSPGSVLAYLLGCLLAGGTAAPASAEDWPQWRGPQGTGVSGERNVPILWNAEQNLAWQTELPGWGASTPVVSGDSVFLTAQTADGRLLVLCVDAAAGKLRWEREAGQFAVPRGRAERRAQRFHELHNLASPSPVTDGRRVIAHFGEGTLVAYSRDGELLWRRNLQEDYGNYTIWYGHANSPLVVGHRVISVCLQDSLVDLEPDHPAASYVVAHDIRDGHEIWKTPRPTAARGEPCDAYTTPLLIQFRDQPQVVVMGGNELDAYAPATGERLWRLPDLNGGRTVPSPAWDGRRLFVTLGLRGPVTAVEVDGSRELSHRQIRWRHTSGSPDSCSPVAADGLLFLITDDGIARCLDAEGGTMRWRKRLPGKYKASPVLCDGRLFFANTEGLVTVVSATRRYRKLAENQLPEGQLLASPAISQGRIYWRTKSSLICVGWPAPPAPPLD